MVVSLSFDIVLALIGARQGALKRLLDSLAAQSHREFRVIVVDQNQDERLTPVFEPYEDRFPIVQFRSQPGLSRARNLALKEASGDVICFADDDCWYTADLLSSVAELLFVNRRWAGVTGRVVDEQGRPSAARWSRRSGAINRTNVWTRGASISIFLRRDVVEQVGGFDESLGLGSPSGWGSGEETDYLLRTLENGFELHYEPTLTVLHPRTRVDLGHEAVAVGRSYGLGFGRVLRKHGYPWWFATYHVGRAIGGALLALGRLDPADARFHMAVARGRTVGWFAREPG